MRLRVTGLARTSWAALGPVVPTATARRALRVLIVAIATTRRALRVLIVATATARRALRVLIVAIATARRALLHGCVAIQHVQALEALAHFVNVCVSLE